MAVTHIDITNELVIAAQAGDLGATASIIEATTAAVEVLALRAAEKTGATGSRRHHMAEEYAAEGRLCVWEWVKSYTPVRDPGARLYSVLRYKIGDTLREDQHAGVENTALLMFMKMLKECNGDAVAAEKACTTYEDSRKRLSAANARAARLAYEGTVSLHAPGPDGGTILDFLSDEEADDPAEVDAERRRRIRDIVHATLSEMTELQRTILWESEAKGRSALHIQEDLGIDSAQYRRNKDKARRNFHNRYPWEEVHSGPKPALARAARPGKSED